MFNMYQALGSSPTMQQGWGSAGGVVQQWKPYLARETPWVGSPAPGAKEGTGRKDNSETIEPDTERQIKLNVLSHCVFVFMIKHPTGNPVVSPKVNFTTTMAWLFPLLWIGNKC